MNEPSRTAPNLRIGLCLSGGGYRAAAFHLGTISYLDECGLLGNLEALSTVSGGTIIGAKYIQSLVDGETFETFFKDFYEFLNGKSLLELCFERLGQDLPNVPSRRVNAVVALAQAYQDSLFTRKNGEPFLLRDVLRSEVDVPEVVFNATEFRSGLPFRFRLSSNGNATQGSRAVEVATEACLFVRIADIVAASSCFPGGFEPLAFPDDLAWPGGTIPEQLRNQFPVGKTVAIMDGGIGDNQGIDALLEATESWQKIDYLIVSDTDRAPGDLYPFPAPADYGLFGKISLAGVHRLGTLLVWACGLSIVALAVRSAYQFCSGTFSYFWDVFLYLVPLALAVTTYLFLRTARSILRNELLAHVPGLGLRSWAYLKRLSLADFIYMIRLRHSSLSVITNSVFMGRIRELIYRVIGADQDIGKKTVKCRITDLLAPAAPGVAPPGETISKELLEAVQVAAAMPTTIWFDENSQQLPDLVICGQATLCHQLRSLVRNRHGSNVEHYPHDIRGLAGRLDADWQEFLKEPRFLLKQLR